eukprot:13889123-Heterocapsa_arctica.AAC.1
MPLEGRERLPHLGHVLVVCSGARCGWAALPEGRHSGSPSMSSSVAPREIVLTGVSGASSQTVGWTREQR